MTGGGIQVGYGRGAAKTATPPRGEDKPVGSVQVEAEASTRRKWELEVQEECET